MHITAKDRQRQKTTTNGVLSGGPADRESGLRDENAVGGDGVVAAMAVRRAEIALFFDVGDLAARGNLAVAAHDTATRKRCEPEKSHETHYPSEGRKPRRHRLPQFVQQTMYR
jgi:hypothetical protein